MYFRSITMSFHWMFVQGECRDTLLSMPNRSQTSWGQSPNNHLTASPHHHLAASPERSDIVSALQCSDRRSRSGFLHTKTTKCELALLKQNILLHVFAHKNLFPPSANCLRIKSPHFQFIKYFSFLKSPLSIASPSHQITASPERSDIVSALHSKPTLRSGFLLYLAKNAMSASLLNAFFLRSLCAKSY